jgi:ribose transport system substrate-binding protein
VPKIAENVDYPISGLGWEVTTDVRANKNYQIACVVKNTVNPYMIGQARGITAAGKAMGFTGLEMAPAEPDSADEQAQIVRDLIARGVDGIAIHPIDSVGLVPACEEAMDAGIPVVNIGTLLQTENKLAHVGTPYYHTGVWIAEWVAKALGGKGKIVNLTGPPEAANAHERNAGIYHALEQYPDIEIIAEQPAYFRRTDALAAMETIIERFGADNIDAVIGANDEVAMGALTALESAGADTDRIVIAGFDANEDYSQALLDGRVDVTFNSDPPSSAWLAAAYLVEYLNDGKMPPQEYVIYPTLEQEGSIVTRENVEQYLENAWWDAPE